jgi:hypothetical protein
MAVVVRRCVVRVVRAGGWSWGPDPRGLLASAVQMLPALLADRLDELVEQHGFEGKVAGPVRVVASVSLADLRAGDQRALGTALDAPLRAALEDTAPAPVAAIGTTAEVDARAPVPGAALLPPPGALDRAAIVPRAPLEQLMIWWREGVLEGLLAGWPERVLLAWAAQLPVAPSEDHAAVAAEQPALRAALVDAAAGAASPPLARAHLAAGAGRAATTLHGATGPARADPRPGVGQRTAAAAPRAPAAVEARALPFLMLVALSRLGYVDALAPTLAAARLAGHAAAFASALARKALDPPERAWRRSPRDLATTAAIAGAATVDDGAIAALARAGADFAPVLDGLVGSAVLGGHERAGHLVLHRSPGNDLVLLDPLGGFPIAIGDRSALAAAAGAPCSAVRVTVSASEPAVLAALDDAGVAFVTTAPPGRRERWTRAGPGRWTNATTRLARRCPDADEGELDALLDALESRPGAAPAARGAFERTLTLAAGAALGMLAWDLWHEREATDARLALRRLGDLDARVRNEAGRVRVTLPLGQRHRDLACAGLLCAIPVPWLDALVELDGG